MVKNYFFILFIFLIGKMAAQAPVMNPIAGASVVCSPPSTAPVYSASASNSPTSYSWSVVPAAGVVIGSPTTATTTINFPTPNGNYTVYCSASNGSGTSANASFVVNVFETPNVTFSGATSFCQGSSTTIMASSTLLSASPTISYFWSPPTGLSTTVGPFVSASPTTNTSYTVTAYNGSCSGTGQITLTVNPVPSLTVTNSNPIICAGDSTKLTATGANFYFWTGGITNGVAFPAYSSNMYYVTGYNTYGCYSTASMWVGVNPAPSIFVSANPPLACMGQSVALTFGGSSTSYSFNAVACGNTVGITPLVNTTYTISGITAQGCRGNYVYTQYIGCVGVNNLIYNEPQGLRVYPNPSAGEFNLVNSNEETVKIVNEFGQVIRSIDMQADTAIKVSGLSAGVYFVLSDKTRIKIIVLN